MHRAGDLSGKVVATCSLPMNKDDTELAAAHALLVAQLAYAGKGGPELAYRFQRFRD